MPGTLRTRLARRIAACAAITLCGCQSTFMNSAANAIGARLPTLVMTEAEENELGAQSYQQVLADSPLSSHPEYQQVVEKVGRRIAAASGRDDYQWEFSVLAGPTQNAFCLPGGKVAVYEGLFPLCENEAGLAVVMSHEIAHALARHGGERMRNQALVDAVGEVVQTTTKEESEQKQLIIQGVYGAASNVGVILPFSRQHESEADSIGLMLMAKAGYDPAEAVRFWKRFEKASGSTVPELLSTHPADARRATDLENLQAQAQRFYDVAPEKLGQGEMLAQLGVTKVGPAATTTASTGVRSTVNRATAATALAAAAFAAKPAVTAAPEASLTSDPWASVQAAENAKAASAVPPAEAPQEMPEALPFERPQTGPVNGGDSEATDEGWVPAGQSSNFVAPNAASDEAPGFETLDP
jgi:predicted Zn-dependent protease